ncbi:hypothetical protein CON13_23670 [Bacillus cereus]|nr:hypothetical protein CON13_23670 [Bacillus cereus]PEE52899.1 hypothetical protein COM80_11270 [Bacillus cereus]PFL87894.1 hypothetical protein COJ35_28375 [Bacillus cereus]PFV64397.1 hypothetical protein COL16_28045 [Bacillus cereus]PGS33253.1 hypothetical protein COC56_25635 [Bacillus cereus]
MNYFCIDVAYKQNNERFLESRMFQTEDDITQTMEAYSVATKRAYKKAFVITQCDLISVTPREVSEIEYKRHALSREGKRDLNLQKRGVRR